ncbi:MAG: F0F1 ATP synthase subunit gamma [Prevotellaceae bacterium]|jgi:F-type H+-transporting ATPase subunit gamma|nr:F0F1 ATP synthase subunit gamma [Prevotellaceae bacterium]
MPSLKEIKGRINSVKSTQKITSAMKMISSAKLRKAQSRVEHFLPYQERLTLMLNGFLSSESSSYSSPLSQQREVKRVALVVYSSNSSLCGAFNSNVINLLTKTVNEYAKANVEVEVYPIGKKIEEATHKSTRKFQIKGSYISLMDKPQFAGAKEIADDLVNDFLAKKIDRVVLIYNHFKSTAVQVPTSETFLPVELKKGREALPVAADYIIEPDKQTLFDVLIPKSLKTKIYSVLLDSAAAEQAARMVAMQIATDNADDLLNNLSIQFNKQRQQAITSELLDIIGGSEALK